MNSRKRQSVNVTSGRHVGVPTGILMRQNGEVGCKFWNLFAEQVRPTHYTCWSISRCYDCSKKNSTWAQINTENRLLLAKPTILSTYQIHGPQNIQINITESSVQRFLFYANDRCQFIKTPELVDIFQRSAVKKSASQQRLSTLSEVCFVSAIATVSFLFVWHIFTGWHSTYMRAIKCKMNRLLLQYDRSTPFKALNKREHI